MTPEVGQGTLAEGSLKRRDAALVVGTTRESFAFDSLVEVTDEYYHTELEAHIGRGAITQCTLTAFFAHSLLIWMLATVKLEHDELGALRNLPVYPRSEVFLFKRTARWCWVIT